MKQKNLKFAVIGIAVLLVASLAFFIINSNPKAPKVVEEQPYTSDYFESLDNCRCVEKERHVCLPEGFEYNSTRKLCINSEKKLVTTSVLKCSEYECSGEIFSYNFESEKWEKK